MAPPDPSRIESRPEPASALVVAGIAIEPGERRRLEVPVARLPTQTTLSLPVAVVHGRFRGPRLWLSAAVHGDEYNGVEIVRRVIDWIDVERLRGTVVAVPIVNVFGFVQESRYLPDRRDLNRSFPGSPRGSLASRLANLFMREIVRGSDYGLDLHTASLGRTNLPQIRADLRHPETRRCAEAFGAPIMIHARLRDGSLREAATRLGVVTLLYEGGEPRRFDQEAIQTGVRGILRVMVATGMEPAAPFVPAADPALVRESTGSTWVRARQSGILHASVVLGQEVRAGEELGSIADALGENRVAVQSPREGLVIGLATNPRVNQGDALVHVARIGSVLG